MKPVLGLSALLVLVLAGCADAPAGPAPVSMQVVAPGDIIALSGTTLRATGPIQLPGPLASEPSIAVTSTGLVGVAAPSGGGNDATVITEGGLVWVSTDGLEFRLALDPSQAESDPAPSAACSCDTDIHAVGDELVAATMYWAVNPAFNVNVVASSDQGAAWDLRSVAAAAVAPVDRPWITGGEEALHLVYNGGNRASLAAPEGTLTSNVYLQTSLDGGTTWAAPVLLAPTSSTGFGYDLGKPRVVGDHLLVPLVRSDAGVREVQNVVAVVDLPTGTTRLVDLGAPHVASSAFSFSLDAHGDEVVAVWSFLDDGRVPRLALARSADGGQTWNDPTSPVASGSFVQPWTALRSDGALAVVVHSSDEEHPISDVPENTTWRAEVLLFEPGQDRPFARHRPQETTLVGNPCNHGAYCPVGSSRSPAREFLSAAWGPDGGLWVAYTDTLGFEDQGTITVAALKA